MNTNNDRSGYIAGTDILKPILTDVLLYAELSGISKELAEQFYWHYEATGWTLPNGGVVRYWQAKLHQWKVSSRVFDTKEKQRDEARTKAQGASKQTGEYYIEGHWWNGYDWYLRQVQENRAKSGQIINIRHEGKAYFRYP